MQDIDSKQVELESVQRQCHSFMQTLCPSEREELEQNMKDVHTQQKKIKEVALEKKRLLNKGISDREVCQISAIVRGI